MDDDNWGGGTEDLDEDEIREHDESYYEDKQAWEEEEEAWEANHPDD